MPPGQRGAVCLGGLVGKEMPLMVPSGGRRESGGGAVQQETVISGKVPESWHGFAVSNII